MCSQRTSWRSCGVPEPACAELVRYLTLAPADEALIQKFRGRDNVLAWRSYSYGEPQGRRLVGTAVRCWLREHAGVGAAVRRAGRLGGGLDGGGDDLCGLRVDGDFAAEQDTADDLPCVLGDILRVAAMAALLLR